MRVFGGKSALKPVEMEAIWPSSITTIGWSRRLVPSQRVSAVSTVRIVTIIAAVCGGISSKKGGFLASNGLKSDVLFTGKLICKVYKLLICLCLQDRAAGKSSKLAGIFIFRPRRWRETRDTGASRGSRYPTLFAKRLRKGWGTQLLAILETSIDIVRRRAAIICNGLGGKSSSAGSPPTSCF